MTEIEAIAQNGTARQRLHLFNDIADAVRAAFSSCSQNLGVSLTEALTLLLIQVTEPGNQLLARFTTPAAMSAAPGIHRPAFEVPSPTASSAIPTATISVLPNQKYPFQTDQSSKKLTPKQHADGSKHRNSNA
ncbi:hypothetical protein [Pseudomonas sp. EMN2]|uniref:hypothetical protein n=1 Tax=Pseudomonas sp. EMN2 TaxID=2615212 RepID=UPI00129BDE70|nr:hypothetical protein [Pseudomonas sp. EMN2]